MRAPEGVPNLPTIEKTGQRMSNYKRLIEIKVHRWRWLKSMGHYGQAENAALDIKDFALRNSTKRS